MDITISKGEKIVHRNKEGMFVTNEYFYSLTETNVVQWAVKKVSQELRLQITKFLCQSEVMDGVKTAEDARKEIALLEESLENYKKEHITDMPTFEVGARNG
jgi:hypothetical protein